MNLSKTILFMLKESDEQENLFKPRKIKKRIEDKNIQLKKILQNPVLQKIYKFMIDTDAKMGNKPYTIKKIIIPLKHDLKATFEFGNRNLLGKKPNNGNSAFVCSFTIKGNYFWETPITEDDRADREDDPESFINYTPYVDMEEWGTIEEIIEGIAEWVQDPESNLIQYLELK